jgi:hypothetical protein
MHILVPYIGVEMPSIRMSEYGNMMGINVDIEHVGRPRLRRAAPGVVGIPHQDYKVRLLPVSEEYRKLRQSPVYYPQGEIHTRRINAVCWHGHKNFMNRLFMDFPNATIRAGYIQRGGVEYNGWTDFLSKYRATKEPFYSNGVKCRCRNDNLAVWETFSHLAV